MAYPLGGRKQHFPLEGVAVPPTSDSVAAFNAIGSLAAAAAESADDAEVSRLAIAAAIAPGALNNATVNAANRTILAGLGTVLGLPAAFDGSLWELVSYASVSASVDIDTAQGIYVRSVSDPSKAWARRFFGALNVAWFGADGSGNDQPGIQTAVKIAELLGLPIDFPAPSYDLWTPVRTTNIDIHNATLTGFAIVVNKPVVFRSLCGGTTLRYLSSTGVTLDTGFQAFDAESVWRGAGILLNGASTGVPLGQRPSITLIDITLDGTVPLSANVVMGASPPFPTKPYSRVINQFVPGSGNIDVTWAAGEGWDTNHKGIWCKNDTYCGNVTLIRSHIKNFAGESIYGALGTDATWVARDGSVSNSNGSLLNPEGQKLQFDNMEFYNANLGMESSGRVGSYLNNCRFWDMREAGGLMGGIVGSGAVTPTRGTDGALPWIDFNNCTFKKCGLVYVLAFNRGNIKLTDSTAAVLGSAFNGLHDVDMDVTSVCDQGGVNSAVYLTGNASYPPHDVRIGLTILRTQEARDNGKYLSEAVSGSGQLGKSIVIENGRGEVNRNSLGTWTGYWPSFRNCNFSPRSEVGAMGSAHDDYTDGSGITVIPSTDIFTIVPHATGAHPVIVSTTGVNDKAEFELRTHTLAGSTYTFAASGSNVKLRADFTMNPDERLRLRYSQQDAKWVPIRVPI